MDMDIVTIQPIHSEQIVSVAGLHGEAFAHAESTILGPLYMQTFFNWFCSRTDAIALGAWVGDSLRAYAIGAPFGYQRRLYSDLFWAAGRSLAGRPWLLLHSPVRTMAWTRLRLILGSQAMSVESLGVSPPIMVLDTLGVSAEWRRRGVGNRILLAFEDEARARCMKALILSVHQDNWPARELYKQRGWVAGPSTGLGRMWYSLRLA